jgi:hypothetical protein
MEFLRVCGFWMHTAVVAFFFLTQCIFNSVPSLANDVASSRQRTSGLCASTTPAAQIVRSGMRCASWAEMGRC